MVYLYTFLIICYAWNALVCLLTIGLLPPALLLVHPLKFSVKHVYWLSLSLKNELKEIIFIPQKPPSDNLMPLLA